MIPPTLIVESLTRVQTGLLRHMSSWSAAHVRGQNVPVQACRDVTPGSGDEARTVPAPP